MKELSITLPVSNKFNANFLLYQSPNKSKCRFYVSVLDENKKAHFFFLEKQKENYWTIVSAGQLPQWVIEMEEQLNEVVAYEMDLEQWHAVK